MLTYIGTFKTYTPDEPLHAGCLHSKDENGRDWYDVRPDGKTDLIWVMFHPDGSVRTWGDEPDRMFPQEQDPTEQGPSVYTTTQTDIRFGYWLDKETMTIGPKKVPGSASEAPLVVG